MTSPRFGVSAEARAEMEARIQAKSEALSASGN
jgi:hypothetical protein